MTTYRLEINHKSNEVRALGIEQGKLTIQQENKNSNILVLHCAGSSYWSGRAFPRSYAGAEYQVFDVIDRIDEQDITHITAEKIVCFPAKHIISPV